MAHKAIATASIKKPLNLTPSLRKIVDTCIGGTSLLEDSKCFYSSIVYSHKSKGFRLINMTTGIPPFDLDWTLYMLFKSYSRGLLVTGNVIRDEVAKGPCRAPSFPHPDLPALYYSRKPEKQPTIIYSNQITDKEIKEFFDLTLHEPVLIDRPNLNTQFQTMSGLPNINSYIEMLPKPVLLEWGTRTFRRYLSEQENMIDGIMLTMFQGDLPDEFLGQPYDIPLEKYFNLQFESQKFVTSMGNYKFQVYKKKSADTAAE